MPPGLGGQGAIPPIYYNPATYAGAGAPVGKGITQASSPTFSAGAIPSLPMQRVARLRSLMAARLTKPPASRLIPRAAMARRAAMLVAAAPQAEPPTQNVPPPPQADPYATATRPQDANPNLPAVDSASQGWRWQPVTWRYWRYCRGLALSSIPIGAGRQWAAGRGRERSDYATKPDEFRPRAGRPRRSHARPFGRATNSQRHRPNGQLSNGMRTLAGMEAVRNYDLTQGNPAKADQMAASMMQYSVSLSQHHGDEAVKAYYKGDLHGAVNELNNASDAVGDGTNYKARVSADGKHVEVSNTDLNGNEVWSQKDVSPQAILGAAIHAKSGALAWSMYEAQAARYDPQTAAIIHDRNQQKTWEHQQQVQEKTWEHQQDLQGQREDARTAAAEAKQAAKDKAAKEQAETESGVLTSMFGGDGSNPTGNPPATATTPPAIPSQPTAPSEGPTPPTTPNAPTAAPQAAPPDADVGIGAGGYQPSPLPTTATVGNPNAPSPDAQNVSSDQGPPVYPNPAKDPRFSQLSPALQRKALDIYRQSVTDRRSWESGQATQGRLDQREHFTQEQRGAQKYAPTPRRSPSRRRRNMRRGRHVLIRTLHATFSTVPDENGNDRQATR